MGSTTQCLMTEGDVGQTAGCLTCAQAGGMTGAPHLPSRAEGLGLGSSQGGGGQSGSGADGRGPGKQLQPGVGVRPGCEVWLCRLAAMGARVSALGLWGRVGTQYRGTLSDSSAIHGL